jgi:hypothetical protein
MSRFPFVKRRAGVKIGIRPFPFHAVHASATFQLFQSQNCRGPRVDKPVRQITAAGTPPLRIFPLKANGLW